MSYFRHLSIIFLSLLLTNLHGEEYPESLLLLEYFYNCDQETSPEEMVDFLLRIKESLLYRDLAIPELTTLFDILRSNLWYKGVLLPDEDWSTFLSLLYQKENRCFLIRYDDVNWLLAWSGSQFVAGGLCYLIPEQLAEVIGDYLVTNSITCLQNDQYVPDPDSVTHPIRIVSDYL